MPPSSWRSTMSMARSSAAPASRPRSSSPSRRFIDKVGVGFHDNHDNNLEEAMRMVAAIAIATWVSLLALLGAGAANAAEIKVLISNALKSTMEELAPQFEKASEHKLVITFGAAAELKTSIEKGAAFDVAVLTTAVTDDLIKEGKLTAAGRADIARAGAGVAARKGAPKPDISTTEGFKRALLEAKSIAYVEAGATAPYIKGLFERLGIAD